MPSEAEKPEQAKVARTCELLEVSKAAYYHYHSLKAEPSARARTDAELARVIAEVHQVSDGTYGSPRVPAELAQRGIACGRRRVARLMRMAGPGGSVQAPLADHDRSRADEQRAMDLISIDLRPSPVWGPRDQTNRN